LTVSFVVASSTIVSTLGNVEGRTRKPARRIQRKTVAKKLYQEEGELNTIFV
jgi:hypothetical protein